jgi:murein DD-endopeptidase MepM/ murein hydrolase activator NlpD
MDERKPKRSARKYLFLIIALALAWGALMTFRVGKPPAIDIEPGMPGIGKRTPVTVGFEESSRGLTKLRVEFVQGDKVEVLAEAEHQPREPWKFWGPAVKTDEITVEVGSETLEGLKTGEATIRASAWPAGTWLRKPSPRIVELVLPVRLTPPAIGVRSRYNYVVPGGSAVVVYTVGNTTVRDGVQIRDWWFPGFPVPGDASGLRFALYAIPFDLPNESEIHIVAVDDVGNQGLASFVDRFFPKQFRTSSIEVSDGFMERVVPAIMSATPGIEDQGDLLQNYLQINGDLRQRNAQTLLELAADSRPEFLWNQAFLPMSDGQVMSSFADQRTYRYKGEAVDQQVHLGFDLASVVHADIQAANRGVVALARYFGIYGNTVVIDHGFGLMSLYSHLSSIEVAAGQPVERGQVVGRSGETGLAGGDHLHFTMLIHGQAVNPVEWWDGAWIRERFAAKLGPAFVFEP